jgi:hypothetical protein
MYSTSSSSTKSTLTSGSEGKRYFKVGLCTKIKINDGGKKKNLVISTSAQTKTLAEQ